MFFFLSRFCFFTGPGSQARKSRRMSRRRRGRKSLENGVSMAAGLDDGGSSSSSSSTSTLTVTPIMAK